MCMRCKASMGSSRGLSTLSGICTLGSYPHFLQRRRSLGHRHGTWSMQTGRDQSPRQDTSTSRTHQHFEPRFGGPVHISDRDCKVQLMALVSITTGTHAEHRSFGLKQPECPRSMVYIIVHSANSLDCNITSNSFVSSYILFNCLSIFQFQLKLRTELYLSKSLSWSV